MKWIFCIAIVVFASCTSEKSIPEIQDNLADYIADNTEFELVQDSLIACAAGGGDVLVNDTDFPISILFYPKGDASEFNYFESEVADINPNDYSNYTHMLLEDAPILNGYLRKFRRESISENVWGIVTYLRDGEIHISNPIRIKYNDKPTENNPDLLSILEKESLMPIFSWEDGEIKENNIYFQVVRDANGNLVSGTYTYDQTFRFYDLSNVVLNIRNVNPAPTLNSGEEYTFIMMAVSEDNWVNLVMAKDFVAE